MAYKIADLENGAFGDTYETLADAEKALEVEIKEGNLINEENRTEYEDAGEEVPRAEDFFSIVEVEAND